MTDHLERYTYPHFNEHLSEVHIGLFVDVKNASEIRSRIIAAAITPGPEGEAEREALNFAFIDARTLMCREHLLAAIYVALVAASNGSLTTRTVHSEVLWALSYSNNITESIKRFGVGDTTQTLAVVRIGRITSVQLSQQIATSKLAEMLGAVVEGQWASMDQLPQLTDVKLVKKYYKLNSEPTLSKDGPIERQVLEEVVISSVALKSVLA